MIVDSSALIAILRQEPEAARFLQAIGHSTPALLSAATFVEASILLQVRFGDHAVRSLDLLMTQLAIEVVTVTAEQALLARRAFRQYGKGLHPASLNFGDCFAYALAKDSGLPLLCKGTDFPQTDLLLAIY